MSSSHKKANAAFMEEVECRNPREPEFQQAVYEVAQDVIPFIADRHDFKSARVLDRLACASARHL